MSKSSKVNAITELDWISTDQAFFWNPSPETRTTANKSRPEDHTLR